jgi:hypothetical protein
LLEEFYQLPACKGGRGHRWTENEDKLLLMFWPHKNKIPLSRKLGICERTAREHYYKLCEQNPERAKQLAEEGEALCGTASS